MKRTNTGDTAKMVDVILQSNEGLGVKEIMRRIGYEKDAGNAYAMLWQYANRTGRIYIKKGLWYKMPVDETVKTQPRTFEWKPLVHSLMAPFQRPVYDAPGCVIRSRMNAHETEVLA